MRIYRVHHFCEDGVWNYPLCKKVDNDYYCIETNVLINKGHIANVELIKN